MQLKLYKVNPYAISIDKGRITPTLTLPRKGGGDSRAFNIENYTLYKLSGKSLKNPKVKDVDIRRLTYAVPLPSSIPVWRCGHFGDSARRGRDQRRSRLKHPPKFGDLPD